MAALTAATSEAALELLYRGGGLLLASDARLPSVSTLVAGEPVRGSWWGHPRGHDIFHALNLLEDHPDIALCRLVDGKVTLVHRDLWPHLVAVGSELAAWQIDGLSPAAAALLAVVSSSGRLRGDTTQAHAITAPARPRDAARELETRLLVYAMQVHTERGAHTRELISWDIFKKARGVHGLPSVDSARFAIEDAVRKLGGDPATALLWHRATAGSHGRVHARVRSHARNR